MYLSCHLQVSTRIYGDIVGVNAKRKDLVPGVAQRDSVVVRDGLAVAVMDKWETPLIMFVSEKIQVLKLNKVIEGST